MAEGKTVNVKIQYNVDSVQVQKAEQLLKQANQASNQFQASAQKAGQTTASSFKTATESIETMRGRLLSLKDRITLATDPAKIKRLSEEYKRLKTQLDAVNKAAFETPKAIKETTDASKSLTSQMGQLATAFKLIISAGIVRETINLTLEMAKLAGNAEGVERAFSRAFPNSVFLLGQLREATHGTITDFELMQRTLQATNLGVAVEQLPILFEFAAARAQQTGESVDYLVDSIVRGIGRKSILVLDNLGLSATRLREQFDGASLASQSVADVTKGVAEIARVELEKMGGYAETSATKVDQLTASVQELKLEVAKKAETGGFIKFLKDAADGLRIMVKGEEDYNTSLNKTIAAKQVDNFVTSKTFKDAEKNNALQRDMLLQEIIERQRLVRLRDSEIDQSTRKLNEMIADLTIINLNKATEGIVNQIAAQKESKQILELSIPILTNYLKKLREAAEIEDPSKGLIEGLQEKIESLNDSIKQAKTPEEIARLNVQLVNTELRLRELQELGKTQINPLSSLIYDLKNFPKVSIKKALPTSEELQSDTADLFKKLGEKQAEEFNKGFHQKIDISTELERALFAFQDEIVTTGIDIFADQLVSFETAELASLQSRLNNLRNFYDEQQILAGDNERAKDELRLREERQTAALQKRIAEQERKARRFSIIIDTAAGIAKAFATSTTVYEGIINAALVAARGASQLAIVNRTPARFAKGVLNINGPGTGTSDSIDAKISKGESVMTANEWKTSKNVLKEVRAKTLDDKVLSDLKLTRDGVKYVGMDDKNIVKEIRNLKNSFPDVEERAGMMYRTKKKTDNYKQWIRLSSMSK